MLNHPCGKPHAPCPGLLCSALLCTCHPGQPPLSTRIPPIGTLLHTYQPLCLRYHRYTWHWEIPPSAPETPSSSTSSRPRQPNHYWHETPPHFRVVVPPTTRPFPCTKDRRNSSLTSISYSIRVGLQLYSISSLSLCRKKKYLSCRIPRSNKHAPIQRTCTYDSHRQTE